LHQALDVAGKSNLANEDGILAIMKSTGVRVVDGDDENDNVTNTGLTFARLNLAAAMQAVGQTSPPSTPTNAAPVLAAIGNRTVAPGGSITIGLSATDPNGDAIVFSARIIGLATDTSQAYQLKQSLGLFALSSYFTNAFGLNEKWLGGSGGNFYTLLPNGELRKWTGTAASTMAAANLIATLNASFYNDPTRLLGAQAAPANPVTANVTGSQLVVAAAASATGSYQIEVTASDGKLAATRTFTVAIAAAATPPRTNSPPTLTVADKINASAGATSVVIPFSANDPNGDPLTVTAQATAAGGSSSLAYQLKSKYNLTYSGSYFTNVYGLGEKWLKSADGLQFFYLLPSGELHKFTGSIVSLATAATLVGTLDKSFYDDPSKLWNATSEAAPSVTASVVNGQVIVTLSQPYHGTVAVDIAVSDGVASVKKTVIVTFP